MPERKIARKKACGGDILRFLNDLAVWYISHSYSLRHLISSLPINFSFISSSEFDNKDRKKLIK